MKKIIISLLITLCFVGVVGCNESDNRESRERKSKVTTKESISETTEETEDTTITSSVTEEITFITLSDNTDENGNRLVASCDDKAIHVTLKYYLSSIENVENNTERIMALLLTSSDYTQADYLTVLIYDKQSEELIMMTMMQNDNGKFKGATGFIWENSEYEKAYDDYMNQISDKIQQHTKTE